MHNLKSYLDYKGVEYKTSGKNISPGWSGMKCLWCDDRSYHLGFKDEIYSCWRCGKKGNVHGLVMKIEKCSFSRAQEILSNYLQISKIAVPDRPRQKIIENVMPSGTLNKFPKQYRNYLKNRNFDPRIITRYGLKAYPSYGVYKFRIIIPVYLNDKIVTFTSRDVTNKREPKYLHCPDTNSLRPIKHCIYNIDSVKKKILIMEGVADVWRMGRGGVAVFGTNVTTEQFKLLYDKYLTHAFIMFDPEFTAQKKAKKLAANLSIFVKNVEIIRLKSGDPADLTQDQADKIKGELFK